MDFVRIWGPISLPRPTVINIKSSLEEKNKLLKDGAESWWKSKTLTRMERIPSFFWIQMGDKQGKLNYPQVDGKTHNTLCILC